MGDSLVPLALAFAVLELDGSPTTLGFVLLGSRLPMIMFTLVGGSVGDRLPRRSVLLAADLGRFIVQALAGWLLLSGNATPLTLGVLAALTGVGAAFFDPAAAALLPSLVPVLALQRANAALGVTRSSVRIAAIAFSGVLVALFGPGWAFVIDAVSFAGSALFISFIKAEPATIQRGRAGLLRTARTGWHEVLNRRWLWMSIMHIAMMNLLVIAPFLVLGPFIAERDLSGATSWAALGTAGAIGALVGNLVAARWKPRRPLLAIYAGTVFVIPLLVLLTIPASIWLLAPAAAFGLAQNAFFNVVHTTAVQTTVASDALATVSSITMLGSLCAVPLGLAVAGPIAQATSTSAMLMFSAVWVAIAGIVMITQPSSRLAVVNDSGGLSARRAG